MKIWPFDHAAEKSRRAVHLRRRSQSARCSRSRRSASAVGDRMDIMVEFHSLWQLLPAMQIARALAPFETFWHEDPIRMDSLAEPQALRRGLAGADLRLGDAGRALARSAICWRPGAAGVVMLDLSWCGGLSEARKIAAMAEAWHLPVAPHDCTGPVVLAASTHLSLNAPNALVQESVRAFYRTWYRDLVTALPRVKDGMITVPPGPGLGLELDPDLDRAFTVTRRRLGRGGRYD